MDDAGISFAYARSWAEGVGLGVLSPGAARVEGYSNFLWVALLAGAERLGLGSERASKVLGGLSLAVATALLWALLRQVAPRRPLHWSALLLPSTLCVALWSMSGLESGLYLALLVGAALFLVREEAAPRPRSVFSAALLFLAGVTRPDAMAFAAAAAVAKVTGLLEPEKRRERVRHVATWAAAFIAPTTAYQAWHHAHFGFGLPNTVYAKGASPSLSAAADLLSPSRPGWRYLQSWFETRSTPALALLAVAGALLALRGPARSLTLLAGAALLLPVVHPDWMVEHRFVVPLVPLVIALAAVAIDGASQIAADRWPEARWLPRTVAGVAIGLGALHVLSSVLPGIELRARAYRGAVTMAEVRNAYERLFEVPVRELGLRDPLYAIPDIGATAYELRYRLLDIAGLADAHVAHAGSDSGQLDLYLFTERRPDLIHAHGWWLVRAGLSTLPGLRRDYLLVSSRSGPARDDNGFEAVRRDLFVERLASEEQHLAMGRGGLVVSRWEGPEVAERRAKLPFDLHLGTTGDRPLPAELQVRLLGNASDPVSTSALSCGPSFYSCEHWAAGERVRQRVWVQAPTETGPVEVQLRWREPGDPNWRVASSRSLLVDDQAATSMALRLVAEADRRAGQADVAGMEEVLEAAAASAPGATDWERVRRGCRKTAARAIAEVAGSCIQRGELACGISTLEGADRIGDARSASTELRALAQRLRKDAEALAEPGRAYNLLRAAWLADPQDAAIQRALIEARPTIAARR